MIDGKRVLAIIPARAGSKRVKNKNIRKLGGVPLIGWTLKDLYKSKYIDLAYVSTDSLEIQKVATNFGIESFPLRSPDLATDHSSSSDVITDILLNRKIGYDIIVLLQPTSPFRTVEHIDLALEQFINSSASSVISVCKTEVPQDWVVNFGEDLSMNDFVSKIQLKRSQDHKDSYQLNGAIYITYVSNFLKFKSFYQEDKTIAFIMKRLDSLDIDTEEDMFLAEALIDKMTGTKLVKS